MTQENDSAFHARQDQVHDWAMDLSHFAERLAGHEPSHRLGLSILHIAAQMEEKAAREQPEEHRAWKTILFRSAGWLYVKAAAGNPRLLEDAQRCLEQGITLHPSFRPELEELRGAVRQMQKPGYRPPEPKPWLACFRCRAPIVWSKHPPRLLRSRELDTDETVARLCSHCEWTQIAVHDGSVTTAEQQFRLSAVAEQIETALLADRRHIALKQWRYNWTRQHPAETTALLATAARLWPVQDQTNTAIRKAVDDGVLIPFGIWPHGQEPDLCNDTEEHI